MMSSDRAARLVVVGHGMVGQRVVEKARKYGWDGDVTIIGDEPQLAYDRVRLTSFFEHHDSSKLALQEESWYEENDVTVVRQDKATAVDAERKTVQTESGAEVPYDHLVLATGSYAWCPPIDGAQHPGVFVYRTIGDLEDMIRFKDEHKCKRAAVIGGGLLGLEAAMVCRDMGLHTTAIDHGAFFMGRQLDATGGKILVEQIKSMGSDARLGVSTEQIMADDEGRVRALLLRDRKEIRGDDSNTEELPVELVIIATGIRPRDELAREVDGLAVHPRGGIEVNDRLETTLPDVYAVGECALHRGVCYGIVAPGYEMADVVAYNLCNKADGAGAEAEDSKTFTHGDMNTKLKLVGVDVASFGDYQAGAATEQEEAKPMGERTSRALKYHDPFAGVYRKLVFSMDGQRLLGGMLVGDASDYAQLTMMSKSTKPLKAAPHELITPPSQRGSGDGGAAGGGVEDLEDSAQICSCNDVSKGDLAAAFRDKKCDTVAKLGKCTGAGTGCGACKPLVEQVLNAEMAAAGLEVNNFLCEHFKYSRRELFDIIKVKEFRSFDALVEEYGADGRPSVGCAVCQPTVANIFASLWNDHILDNGAQRLQLENDKFLANTQRGGSYSVVPRMPGGEVTPDQLIVLGEVAKRFDLYVKVTGGQRVDLFGAQLHQLPEIWEELIAAGMETGAAYNKGLRTVKSCVGSSWCRYGMRASVDMAVLIEHRYKGLRSPHKLKMAVSGCLRECAEAQSKDVGLIATEEGYNVYVAGNGGSKPRHATLLASSVPEDLCIKYIDRFLMFYISTADKLQRTARWFEQLEGGIDYVRSVVIDDKLGLCAEFERMMQHVVDTYQCEWKSVVEDPERRKMFRQFINTSVVDEPRGIEFVNVRGQPRPARWPKDRNVLPHLDLELDLVDDAGVLDGSASLAGSESTSSLSALGLTDSESESGSSRGSEDSVMRQASWRPIADAADVQANGGAAVLYGNVQLAVFNFAAQNRWYCTQNMCPKFNTFTLSRGFLQEDGPAKTPLVLDPHHRTTFNLQSGREHNDGSLRIRTFPIRVRDGQLEAKLPPTDVLDAVLATTKLIVRPDKTRPREAAESPRAAAVCGDPTVDW